MTIGLGKSRSAFEQKCRGWVQGIGAKSGDTLYPSESGMHGAQKVILLVTMRA